MPLPLKQRNDLANGWKDVVGKLGTKFSIAQPDGTAKGNLTGHIIPAGRDDVAIVNALGLEAVFLHVLPTPLLKKFDELTAPSGRIYVVNAIHEVYVNDILVGYKVTAL